MLTVNQEAMSELNLYEKKREALFRKKPTFLIRFRINLIIFPFAELLQ